MIKEATKKGRFIARRTKRLITLLHKQLELYKLGNWRPITLLNVTLLFFAKAMQSRLQPNLMEIINMD